MKNASTSGDFVNYTDRELASVIAWGESEAFKVLEKIITRGKQTGAEKLFIELESATSEWSALRSAMIRAGRMAANKDILQLPQFARIELDRRKKAGVLNKSV